jgi:hypothetical protein
MITTNAGIVRMYEGLVADFRRSGKQMSSFGEKDYATKDYKQASKYGKTLAKVVAAQKEMKLQLAQNNRDARIAAKKLRLFGIAPAAPLVTSFEMEQMLDELIELRFPAKQDTRPADHPSRKKVA